MIFIDEYVIMASFSCYSGKIFSISAFQLPRMWVENR